MSDSSFEEPKGSLLPGKTYFGRFSPEKTKFVPVVRDDNLGVEDHVGTLGLPSPSSFRTPGGNHYKKSRFETPESLTSPGGSSYYRVSKYTISQEKNPRKALDFSSVGERPSSSFCTLSIFKAGEPTTEPCGPTISSTSSQADSLESDNPFLFFEAPSKISSSKPRESTKKAMKRSAREYVEATAHCPGVQGFLDVLRRKLEWGHVGAHCLNGTNRSSNLAVIPYDANSQMMVLETLAKDLHKVRQTKYESEMALIPADPSEEQTKFLHIAQEVITRLTLDDAIEIKHHIRALRPHCLERPLIENIIDYLDMKTLLEDFREVLAL